MLILKYLLCFIMALNFVACADISSSQSQIVENKAITKTNNSFEANQYAVYDALIAQVFGNSSTLVIIERTNTDYRDDPMLDTVLTNVQKQLPSLSKSTVDDFRARNQTRVPLKDLFKLPGKRVFITDEELKAIFKDGLDWKAFYEKYPNSQGVMTLSNVGFDSEMKQAFVYAANTKGSLDGVGYYIVLEKRKGKWKLKEKFTGWVS